jgi:serine/threonine-protein kinase
VAESFAAGLVGVVLDDRYRLDALIGEGGMGAVFRATHLAMERRVAVKLLKPHLTSDTTQLQRFAREARSTMKVDSPHAVKVLDFGVTPQRDYYMVLEYLDGRTVQRELDVDGPFSPARAVHVARQALQALGAAHKSGLVHRDVKPDNLLLMRSGSDPDYTKVLDFGVAKLMEGAPRSSHSALALTQAGMVFGTPEFMSPEQACGHPLDGRSDLYSLAATMFAMLTGCGLFEGGSPIEWLTNHARTPPPHLAMVEPKLGAYPELDALLQRCLAKQRDQRPKDAEEMERLLGELVPTLSRAPGEAPPKTAAAAVAGVAGKSTMFSSSGFLDMLPPEAVAAGETLVPAAPGAGGGIGPSAITSQERPGRGAAGGAGAGAGVAGGLAGAGTAAALPFAPTGASPELPATTASTRALPRQRSRGLLLALGAITVVAMIGVAIGLAVTRRPSRSASITDAAVPPPAPDARGAKPRADAPPAAPADAPPTPADAAHAPADAAHAPAVTDAGTLAVPRLPADAGIRPLGPPGGKKALVENYLKAAVAALRENNRLQYLYQSEKAYEADPSEARASLMYADALIKNGSKDRGCELLRKLKALPAARDQVRAAECPTD